MLQRGASTLQDAPSDVDEAWAALGQLAAFAESMAEPDDSLALPAEPFGQGPAHAQYRNLIEQIPAVTFLASLAGGRNQLYVSPQIETLLGFSQKEWLSDPILWYRQTHPDDRARVSALFAESCATGRPFSDVFRVLTRTQETVWVHAQAHFVRDPNGQLLFLQGVGFDVTEQHRAREAREQLIREQAARAEADRERNRLRDIFTHLPAAIALVSGKDHIVEFMNPGAIELAHLGANALRQPFATAFPEFGGLAQLLEAARSSTQSVTIRELNVSSARWPDERFFDAFCRRIAFGRERLVLVRLEETTDQVRARRDVEAALNLRDEFLSIASHELRTPIAALVGQAQLAQRRLQRSPRLQRSQIEQGLASILRQTAKLTQLVTQLLDVSRFENGKLAIQRGPCDLPEMVTLLVERARAIGYQHEITVAAPPELYADIDGLRVEQVVSNLLDNAIKYSPGGGGILVRAAESPLGWAELSVRDHGMGIPTERRQQIFERFYQAHDGRRGGLGLGLYISQQIVDLHGGRIEVEFPPDGGTKFTVRLPLK
jgi:PAS domain S-box-containing protein